MGHRPDQVARYMQCKQTMIPIKSLFSLDLRGCLQIRQLSRIIPIMHVTSQDHFKNCYTMKAAGGRLKAAPSETSRPNMTARPRTDKLRHAANLQWF